MLHSSRYSDLMTGALRSALKGLPIRVVVDTVPDAVAADSLLALCSVCQPEILLSMVGTLTSSLCALESCATTLSASVSLFTLSPSTLRRGSPDFLTCPPYCHL